MKNIIIFLVSLTCLYSCSNEGSNYSGLTEINISKTNAINDYYEKIDKWNIENVNWRMKFLKKFTTIYRIGFDSLNKSIKNRNLDLFTESKSNILNEISSFLEHTTEVEPWVNNQYFWVIEKAKDDISKLTISEKHIEIELMESHEIEESLISTFYLLGYSDQYCFNKMEPFVHSYDINSDYRMNQDTNSYGVYSLAFDSVSYSKISYQVSNGHFSLKDSNINHFDIPRKSGINNYTVTYYPYYYGKEHIWEFDQDIFIR